MYDHNLIANSLVWWYAGPLSHTDTYCHCVSDYVNVLHHDVHYDTMFVHVYYIIYS